MDKKVGLLIGSGVSCAVEYPGMSEITNSIRGFSGTPKSLKKYNDFVPGDDIDWDSKSGVLLIQDFLNHICCLTQDFYYYQSRTINYEDLYYILRQIEDSDSDEFENPVTEPFCNILLEYVERRRNDLKKYKTRNIISRQDDKEFTTIVKKSLEYIKNTCISALSKGCDGFDKLSLLNHLFEDNDVKTINVFTTNHDTLLEQLLQNLLLDYTDGFGKGVNNARWYDPILLDNASAGIILVKLHGSVNWQYFPDVKRIGIVNNPDNRVKDDNGKIIDPGPGSPLFLIGTFNKMLGYSNGIYADMFTHFNKEMRYANRLIISGYGFGDKGINTVLVNWFWQNEKNRAVVIHPKEDRLITNARAAISNNWQEWKERGQIVTVEKGIENGSWEEVKSKLFDNGVEV